MTLILLLTGVILGYAIGSISSAILVCRLFGLPDPREAGSHNPGTTNVLRLGGKVPAAFTLLGDVLKGLLPVILIKLITSDPWVISAVLLAVVMGHLYPLYFQFKGGKGVATAWGALIGLSPWLGLLFAGVWLSIFAIFRYSSLSALIALLTIPVAGWFLLDKRYVFALVVLVIVIFWRHRDNIQRLMRGEEKKFLKK